MLIRKRFQKLTWQLSFKQNKQKTSWEIYTLIDVFHNTLSIGFFKLRVVIFIILAANFLFIYFMELLSRVSTDHSISFLNLHCLICCFYSFLRKILYLKYQDPQFNCIFNARVLSSMNNRKKRSAKQLITAHFLLYRPEIQMAHRPPVVARSSEPLPKETWKPELNSVVSVKDSMVEMLVVVYVAL